jgi:NitT/TauT family transport system substrate-binding protein
MYWGLRPATFMLRRTLLLSSLAPAFTTISCSRSHSGRTAIRVAPSPYLVSAPFYLGVEAGYFKDAGLDLALMKELPSLQSVPLLAAGKQDVGFIGLTTGLLNAMARGARVRIVAALEIVSPSCPLTGMIYVRSRDFPNGVQDMRQLRRRRVSVVSATGTWMFGLDKLLERAGMSRSDIEIHVLSATQRVAALRSGSVDALLVTSIDMTPMLQSWGMAPGPAVAGVLPGFQCTFMVFGTRLLDGNVRNGALFLRAWRRGLRDFQAGKTPAFVDQFATSYGMDPRQVRAGCRDAFQNDGRIHDQDIQTFIEWGRSHGDLQHSLNAQDVVDTRFLNAVQDMS